MLTHIKNKIQTHKEDRKLRKKKSDLGISLFDSIQQAPSEHWQMLTSNDLFMGKDYLSVLEDNPPANMKFYYSLMYQDKKPVAAAYFQLIEFTAESFGSLICPDPGNQPSAIKKMIKELWHKHANKIAVRILVAGNSYASGQHGFVYDKAVDPKLAFRALADVIYRIRRADKLNGQIAAVIAKDFYSDTKVCSDELKRYKYYEFMVEPNMILNMDPSWRSFEDYLEAMSSKYRARAKNIQKKGASAVKKSFSDADIILNLIFWKPNPPLNNSCKSSNASCMSCIKSLLL